MRVVIAGIVYDSNDELIVLEVSPAESRDISEMHPTSNTIWFGGEGRYFQHFLDLAKRRLAGEKD